MTFFPCQGGAPSPFDRNFGTKIAAKAMQWITRTLKESYKGGKHINVTLDSSEDAEHLGVKLLCLSYKS